MAITSNVFQSSAATPQSVTFVSTQSAAAGDQVTLSNATLVAAMVTGPLKLLFQRTYADQATARNIILEGELGSIGSDVKSGGVKITYSSRLGNPWGFDVNVDGSLLPTLLVSVPAAIVVADVAVVRVTYVNSFVS